MPISKEEWAYLAGFLDGEGCIQAYKTAKRARRPKITIAQKDGEVLFWIQETFGGGLWHNTKSGDYWLWYSDNLELTDWLLRGVLPFLKLKRYQALVAMALCERPDWSKQDRLFRLLRLLKRMTNEEIRASRSSL